MSEEQLKHAVDNIEDVEVNDLEDWMVDRYIEDIKANNEDLKRYEDIMNRRIDELKGQYNRKKDSILKNNHFLLTTLNTYAKRQKSLKETETQQKYTSLSGEVIIKKPVKKMMAPTKEKVEKLVEAYPEYKIVEEVVRVDWKELKKRFDIKNEKAYDKETGEEVSDLVTIEDQPEETIIK